MIVLRRPTPFGGALVVLKHRRFDRILDGADAATDSFGDYSISELTDNHISNLLMLGR